MDFALTDEQVELQEVTRKFAYEELLPESLEADRQTAPEDCFRPALVKRASELGLRTLKIPREYGGRGADCVTEVLVLEELCTADVGFGMSIQHPWREGYALAVHTTPAQRDRYLPDFLDDPTYLTSFGITEEHWGSDASGTSADHEDGPRTTAVREGDEWVLNGRKRWITNANISRMAIILARTDETVPWRDGVSMFLVPTDTPGYKVGRIEDKLGIRMNPNAEIVLDDCRIPADNLLGEFNAGITMRHRMGAGSKVKTATKALGIARAAYEEAVHYARERVQGGKPIIEHQSVAAALVEVEMGVEALRSMIWRSAWAVDQKLPQASRLEAMAKDAASKLAIEAATTAMEIHGSYGVMRSGRIEKIMRDAATILHTGTANHAMKAILGKALADKKNVVGWGL